MHVSASLSAYVCQCVTEGEPGVSVSPSVSETRWSVGVGGACWGSLDA